MVEKLKLLKILKNSFKKDNISNAFDVELKIFLQEMDPLKIPDNLTSFYYTNIQIEKNQDIKIKFNNEYYISQNLLTILMEIIQKIRLKKT